VFTQAELDQLAIDLAKGDLAKDEHEGHEKQQGGIKRSADEAEIEESDGSESGPRKKVCMSKPPAVRDSLPCPFRPRLHNSKRSLPTSSTPSIPLY
jgi:hypothetical protein